MARLSNPTGLWIVRSKTTGEILESYVVSESWSDFTRPRTGKRIKPADLFANRTARAVSSETVSFHPASYSTAFVTASGPSSGLEETTYFDGTSLDSYELDFSDLDSKLRLKIKDQKVNLGNALGEYRQTADLVSTLARDLFRTFQSLRSGRAVGDFINTLSNPRTRNGRAMANRWLQYQYGLKPLMNDIYGTAEEARKKVEQGMVLFSTVTDEQKETITRQLPLGYVTTSVELKRRCRARYMIKSPGLKTLSSLGAVNPASVVWELIPWSFVIDWALPIGDFLSGLDATAGISNLVVARGYRRQSQFSVVYNKLGNASYGKMTSIGGNTEGTRTETRRLEATNSLSIGYPRPKNPATLMHMLNSLALIRQLKR